MTRYTVPFSNILDKISLTYVVYYKTWNKNKNNTLSHYQVAFSYTIVPY